MTWLLNGTPFDVQSHALKLTNDFPEGYAYFMEMGTGKTATLLADFERLKCNGLVDVLVIVCPNSLKSNWAKEITAMCPRADERGHSVWPHTDLNDHYFILNYEAFSSGARKGESFVRDLCREKRVMLGLDESTQIKNYKSKRTKSLLGLAREAAYTRVLSGHPMVQGPQDIWSQLKFIGGMKGVNFFQFRNRFCVMGGYMGKQILGPNPNHLPELNYEISCRAFRAKKEDWLDLPSKMYYNRELGQNSIQAREYKRMCEDLVAYISENEMVEAAMVLTKLGKLAQISSNFLYDENKVAHEFEGVNYKYNEVLNILEEIDTKLLIATVYRYSTDMLIEKLNASGHKTVGIHGGMTDEQLDAVKAEFNNGDARVIVCQSSAAKYGHTLLGTKEQPCHTTLFYENSFSLDDRVQMEDRIHRIGQKFGVNIIDVITSPVDRLAADALQRKQEVAGAVVDAIKVQNIS